MAIFVNGTLENLEKVEFFIKGVAFKKIMAIGKDGKEQEIAFSNTDGFVQADLDLPYMSTVTLRLIKE